MEFTPKRDIAKQFLNLIYQGSVEKAFSNYTGPEFKHHLVDCKQGKLALMAYLKVATTQHQFLRLIEQNDLVMVHAHEVGNPSNQEYTTVYIMRFKEQMISELWRVSQDLPNVELNLDGGF